MSIPSNEGLKPLLAEHLSRFILSFPDSICTDQKNLPLSTLIGTIPGLLTFVFLGGSLLDVRYLILAAAFLTFGLTVSFWLKKTLLIENLMEKG